MEAQQKID